MDHVTYDADYGKTRLLSLEEGTAEFNSRDPVGDTMEKQATAIANSLGATIDAGGYGITATLHVRLNDTGTGRGEDFFFAHPEEVATVDLKLESREE